MNLLVLTDSSARNVAMPQNTMRFAATMTSLALFWCAGCGKGLPVAPVSGTVTLDGQPLANATITTQPIGTDTRNPGPGSFGRTDAEGRFELEVVNPAIKGAIIGEHRVMISPAAGTEGTQPQRTAEGVLFWTDDPQNRSAAGAAESDWPSHFMDGSLKMSVPPEGINNLRFDLKRK